MVILHDPAREGVAPGLWWRLFCVRVCYVLGRGVRIGVSACVVVFRRREQQGVSIRLGAKKWRVGVDGDRKS